MRFRIKKVPRGAKRFAYAYLAAILSSGVASLIAVLTGPSMGSVPLCSTDVEGNCALALTGMLAAVLLFACFFVAARIFRLGWQWAAWLMAWTLILFQIVLETGVLGLLWLIAILPAIASAITLQRPGHPPTKLVSGLRLAGLIIALAQFVIWFVVFLIS